MNHIWTPWRMKYIQGDAAERACAFCLAAEREDGQENLVFHRGENLFMILNRYPYTSGHMMCVPFLHVSKLDDLTSEARCELMELVAKAVRVLSDVYKPEGFNVGMNLGSVAGAGIADHLHMHIVPRWGGDTSFISILSGTRVVPESLEVTYQKVKEAWERVD
ncbi:MAG: AP-4-A phosphorylase [Chloroflexi bacterium ADurb.Bin120]|jgi:ATP adenylyltransferase|uniref:AP-4-A phosphorylase n=2 Tax=Candidatus Brevifilum fermentans TaxID=1986204 RepID=A0A1Y6K685_9CHLR|nr:MAG: AP-4-A phosphorylase [Chloroflexi bacterium ADurb.Bin120]SMX55153.1 AP-4-A phosphorylase [Brevefilum fermentans]